VSALPAHARCVVVGGGIAGCAVAYHLAKRGWREVVLLEQGRLTGGTTWHAAGLVGQLRPSANLTRLIRASARLYAALEAETGQATGWKACGAVNLATTPERMVELRRAAAMATLFGVEAHLVGPHEAGRLWPHMRTDDIAGAAWLPGDGKANPADLTQALARGARAGGVTIREGVKLTGLRRRRLREGHAVTGVETSAGAIACEAVVLACGLWSRELGRRAGVAMPLQAAEHMYVVTRPLGLSRDLPVLRDYDNRVYFKEEVGGLVMGGFEAAAKPWGGAGIPEPFEFQLLPEDWEQFGELMQGALRRCPLLETAEVRQLLVGPESFTPDGQFLMGEAPGVRGLWVMAGFNSAGIASAGGAGEALADWMEAGEPPFDLWEVDVRRFGPFHANPRFLEARVVEELGLHYAMHWPHFEARSARPMRVSPLHARLERAGACFGTRYGWERPLWFGRPGERPEMRYGWGRQGWFAASAAEHRAVREGVGLLDQSSFGKLRVAGPDAEAFLQRLCAADVAVPPGRVVYAQMLNARGGIESDVTVHRLAHEAFLLVTAAAQAGRDLDRLRRLRGEAERVEIADVTTQFAVLSVMGPRSRTLLQGLTTDDLSDAALPYMASRELFLGLAEVRAARLSYVGEPGYELYVPVEMALPLYDALTAAGAGLGLRDFGYLALESLRIEKAYRAWGHDLSPDDTPLEAGLGFAVRLGKPGGFLGREALLRQREAGLARRLVLFAMDEPEVHPWHDEPILRDGRIVGRTTSAAYGHTVGRMLAFGYVAAAPGETDPLPGEWRIEIAGRSLPAVPCARPPYDPVGLRLKG